MRVSGVPGALGQKHDEVRPRFLTAGKGTWRLIVDVALLCGDVVKPTVIYVKCCADPVRLFGCILLRLFNFCLLHLFVYFVLPHKMAK